MSMLGTGPTDVLAARATMLELGIARGSLTATRVVRPCMRWMHSRPTISSLINTSRVAGRITDDWPHLCDAGERGLFHLVHHHRMTERNQMTTMMHTAKYPKTAEAAHQKEPTLMRGTKQVGVKMGTYDWRTSGNVSGWRQELWGILQVDRERRAVSSSCQSLSASRSAALGPQTGRYAGRAHPSAMSVFQYGQPSRAILDRAVQSEKEAGRGAAATLQRGLSPHVVGLSRAVI